jgi:hypothetical protein
LEASIANKQDVIELQGLGLDRVTGLVDALASKVSADDLDLKQDVIGLQGLAQDRVAGLGTALAEKISSDELTTALSTKVDATTLALELLGKQDLIPDRGLSQSKILFDDQGISSSKIAFIDGGIAQSKISFLDQGLPQSKILNLETSLADRVTTTELNTTLSDFQPKIGPNLANIEIESVTNLREELDSKGAVLERGARQRRVYLTECLRRVQKNCSHERPHCER